jgi:methyl-accepting chemotaxis protein
MVSFERLTRLKISTKLSSVVGSALLALCVMGALAVFAAREIQSLGHELYVESDRLSHMEMGVSVAIERAIGDVHSAPSETELEQLKTKRAHFQAVLGEAKTILKGTLAPGTASDVTDNGNKIVAAIAAFEDASAKVFELAASFAQPDAIAALSKSVAPAEIVLEAALKQFQAATNRSNDAKVAAMRKTAMTITWIVVGLAIFLVLALSALAYVTVSRGVARPITAIHAVMTRLSQRDLSGDIPYASRRDEIGDMARTIAVFKQNAVDRIRLEAEQKETDARAVTTRKNEMHQLADKFEAAVGNIVNTVSSASTELEATATTLMHTADTTQQLSNSVAEASEQASANVQSVASATDEMSQSVNEISRQVQESSRIAGEAVKQAETTDARIGELSKAASRIGDVIKLITAVAEQTNLLALNATIEAARAGEAGRGFAVVASEVKALASQTAKATDEIGAQIASMQSATRDSVAAIKEIGGTINRVSEIATMIAAAVEEQGAATQEISRNVQQAAEGTTQVALNIVEVNKGAAETGSASSQVLTSAQALSTEGAKLKTEMNKFLATVRAAA